MRKLTLLLAAVLTVLGANAWTVKFTNPNNWTKVNVYTFSPETEGGWPGNAMTKEGDVWTFTSASEIEPAKIIFNGTGGQTGNLDFVAGATYDMNGPVGAEIHTYTVYFDNSTANWAEVYLYTWGPVMFGDWPGKKLAKNADGLYVASYEATSEQNFDGMKFNNGKGTETVQLTWENDAIYNENGKVGDQPVDPNDDYTKWYVNIGGAFNADYWTGTAVSADGTVDCGEYAIGTDEFKVKIWNGVGDKFYSTEDKTIATGSTDLIASTENECAMTITGATAGQKYEISYNCKTNTITITEAGTPTPPPAKKFGLVGSMQDWNIAAPMEMEETGENVFSYGLESVAEGALFKIATIAEYATDQEAWDNTYGAEAPLGSEDAPAVNVVNGEPMNAWLKSSSNFCFDKAMTDVTITFTYNATAGEASTVTVTGTVVDTPASIEATFNFPEICDDQPTSAWMRDGNTGNTYIDMTEAGFSSNGITLTCEKTTTSATGMRLYKSGNYKDLRGYKNSPITIACPQGYHIESIKAYSNSAAGTANLRKVAIDENLVSGEELTTDLPEGMQCGYEWKPASDNTLRQFITLSPTATTRFTIVNVVATQSPTGVEAIGADVDENAPVEYYNLNGVRVAEPENGIFIRRQGSTVTKVIVR